jgi:hypothetical protein
VVYRVAVVGEGVVGWDEDGVGEGVGVSAGALGGTATRSPGACTIFKPPATVR